MRMFIFLFALLVSSISFAQSSDDGRISIQAIIPDGDMPVEACHNLETRMQRMLTNNGYGDNGYIERFVLTAKRDVISKDIVPSTPARVSEEMEVTFFVGDVIENKLYASATIMLKGIGTNENKALISAFSKINPNQKNLIDMLSLAKNKIIDFYANHCAEEIRKAQTMASMGNYDEAIARMMAVPNVCSDCYDRCQENVVIFYQQKIDAFSLQQLNKARNAWMKGQDAAHAEEVAEYLNKVSPNSSSYKDAVKFRNAVADKLKMDERREWDFLMQQYKDEQANKTAVIKACREVATAWARNRPKTIINIIRGW